MSAHEPRIAVLFDAENVPASCVSRILLELHRHGTIPVRRAYADFSSAHLQPWSDVCAASSITPKHLVTGPSGKNAADILFVVDAMDLLHEGNIDWFTIVTSDSDFTPLVLRIRETGRPVWIYGHQRAPVRFRNAATRFINIENLNPQVPANLPDSRLSSLRPAHEATTPIRNAMTVLLEAHGDSVSIADVEQLVQRNHPDFDVRSFGFRQFDELMDALKSFVVERSVEGDVRLRLRRRDERRRKDRKKIRAQSSVPAGQKSQQPVDGGTAPGAV